MNLEFLLAWKFLKAGKLQTILIILGIAVGVSIQVFIGSLIDGLQQDLINRTIGNSPHIFIKAMDETPTPQISASNGIYKNTKIIKPNNRSSALTSWNNYVSAIKKISNINVISPNVLTSSFISKGNIINPITLRGIEMESADKIYNIKNRIIDGSYIVNGNNIVIGKTVASDLDVSINDIVKISTPNGNSDLFYISGIFDLENESLNQSWVLMDLNRTQKLLNLDNNITLLEIQVNDVFKSREIDFNLSQSFNNLSIENWQENNTQLLTALSSQSSSTLLIQVFVLIAVTLGISSVLAITVIQKSKQIGILKAMGIKTRSASKIFLIQGFILGLIGSILGSTFGIVLTQIFLKFATRENGDPLFPLEIKSSQILTIIIIATLASTIAALVPARNSAKLNPIEVIRNG